MIRRIFFRDRKLKMIWAIRKNNLESYLIGSAHFSPYRFERSLEYYISKVDTVLFEGPLDEKSMNKVIQRGFKTSDDRSLLDVVEYGVLRDLIQKLLLSDSYQFATGYHFKDLHKQIEESYIEQLKELKVWSGFFALWSEFLKKRQWKYSVDKEAYKIAKKFNKQIVFLETIDEQIQALENIPVKRILSFIKNFEQWDKYSKKYKKYYLKGDIQNLMFISENFPTRCESIVEKRDLILYERMHPFLERNSILVFCGTIHIKGITERLIENGYKIKPYH